jgi:hypothetical protein
LFLEHTGQISNRFSFNFAWLRSSQGYVAKWTGYMQVILDPFLIYLFIMSELLRKKRTKYIKGRHHHPERNGCSQGEAATPAV